MLSAAYFGHSDVCELFLEACGDVEERHPDTLFTPLHYAARYGQEVRNHVRIAGGVRPLRLKVTQCSRRFQFPVALADTASLKKKFDVYFSREHL